MMYVVYTCEGEVGGVEEVADAHEGHLLMRRLYEVTTDTQMSDLSYESLCRTNCCDAEINSRGLSVQWRLIEGPANIKSDLALSDLAGMVPESVSKGLRDTPVTDWSVSVTAIYIGSVNVQARSDAQARWIAEQMLRGGHPVDLQFSGYSSFDNPEEVEADDDDD